MSDGSGRASLGSSSDRRGRPFSTFYEAFLDATSFVCAAIILAIMVGVAVDVASRYFFGRPFAWMFELTEYALLYIPCLGMGWLARERGHVAIDTFVSKMPEFMRRRLFLVTNAGCIAVCGIIAFWGAIVVLDRYRRGTVIDQMLTIPEYLILWVIPFGFALAAIEFTRLFVRRQFGSAAS
jgi:TRAP-type C4-dicarboxylate transport system permease small subunit